jgi:flagellar basal-body rod protein FlgG
MVRGFYSAAAGVFGQQKSFNTISNNIANASTAGYKNQGSVVSSFGSHMISRMSSAENLGEGSIGKGDFITANSSTFTDYTQGAIQGTERSLDMAIEGSGFFLLKNQQGEEVLSRNGQFFIDQEGELALSGTGKVLDTGRNVIPIQGGDFTVDGKGNIRMGEKTLGTLFIAAKGDESKLVTTGNGNFKREENILQEEEGSYLIHQGALEKSNMDISSEMSKIIAGQNRYQSCTQILKIYDKINEMTVSQIGRIG